MKTDRLLIKAALSLLLLMSSVPMAAQMATAAVELTDHLSSPIMLVNQPLNALIANISMQTNVAFCTEDVLSDPDTGLLDLPITFSASEDDNIIQVLDRLHSLYPQVRWELRGGIIILRDSRLDLLHDDPLSAKAEAAKINGTITDIKLYLETGIEGFNPAIIETTGTVNRKTFYDVQVASGMSVRDILTLLTRRSGLRWRARIRPERMRSPDAPFELPRVFLSFLDGWMPNQVSRAK
jgi:hypothetical protein